MERTISFNDARKTFYLWFNSVRHMVKDHSAREEARCRHMGYSFRLAASFFYMHQPTDRLAHTMGIVTPVVEHWMEREIAVFHKLIIMISYLALLAIYV